MVNFFGATYRSLLLKLSANKEVTFNCNDLIRPMFPSVYHGGDVSLFKITASGTAHSPHTDSQQREGREMQLQAKDDSGSLISIVTIDGTDYEEQNILNNKNDLYIFTYDTPEKCEEMVCRYNEYLVDGEVLTVLMSSTCYKFILNAMTSPSSSVTVEIRDVGKYWQKSLVHIFLAAFLCLIHYACISVVKHISKLDPVFADFDIASSNIAKFKDLPKAQMPQCSICFEEFIPEDDVRVLDCKHYYHPTCIDRWLIGHSKRCPCCRNSIEINEKV